LPLLLLLLSLFLRFCLYRCCCFWVYISCC
jgi:hypothetical protein